ncbi:unnamed protein product [Didymodactylos carnosus]|uniref:Uncharacterized protein n=1 Tax=Didymodactylos carnosus TaxID=1234261 RepID=A0A8S2DT90_9BILA|nr:unnamed protein product [Didymodactylos carnosus]CAF3817896.1 unnamed protein product [Didymodactylos carnosus]
MSTVDQLAHEVYFTTSYDNTSRDNVGFYNEHSSIILSDDEWLGNNLVTSELTEIICQDSYHHEILDHVVDELLAYIEVNSEVESVTTEDQESFLVMAACQIFQKKLTDRPD